MTIRELVEKAIEDALECGSFIGLSMGPAKLRARHDQKESRTALLAAIERLERKAATAKAECDAARDPALNNQHSDAGPCWHCVVHKALSAARAATDEAWREPENKEPNP